MSQEPTSATVTSIIETYEPHNVNGENIVDPAVNSVLVREISTTVMETEEIITSMLAAARGRASIWNLLLTFDSSMDIYIGMMDDVCPFCDLMHFKGELLIGTPEFNPSFSKFCSKDNIYFPSLPPSHPLLLQLFIETDTR